MKDDAQCCTSKLISDGMRPANRLTNGVRECSDGLLRHPRIDQHRLRKRIVP